MDFFQWMLLIVSIAGAIFILFSIIPSVGEKKEEITEFGGSLAEYSNNSKTGDVDTSLYEADQAISELNGMSKSIFKEIDNKYDELLFLYNLIDEKKKEIDTMPLNDDREKSKQLDIVINDNTKKTYNNPHLQNIIKLKKSGLPIAEIAKTLSLGQSEVALILELYERTNKSV